MKNIVTIIIEKSNFTEALYKLGTVPGEDTSPRGYLYILP
jgi:hypothetical protein